MSRGINQTVPSLLRANIPVSDQRLQSELRSLDKAIRYHLSQVVRERLGLDSALPDAMIPSTKKIMRLLDERIMVQQDINDRLALVAESVNRDN
jgi:hypothetical protein